MRSRREKKTGINPVDVILMTIFGCVTTAAGTIAALAVPVAVIVFIVLPIFPSSAHLVESYACDPGGVIEIEEWSYYDHEDQVDESGTDFLCVYEDGSWTESSTEILFAMIGFGVLVPGALAGVLGALLGFMGGISPTKKKERKIGKRAKRAGPDTGDADTAKEEVPSDEEPSKGT